ncbi:MAG: succinyldiaminopimelate transaminase [Gammaproteobacteria bacterium]|nr:succinyldiaminopimelate transaminase [Gammaproteobacteria bacterium]
MNPDLDRLQPYPFERLARLKDGVQPPDTLSHINLSIGEPRHQPPEFVAEEMYAQRQDLGKYPVTRGSIELRTSIVKWLSKRFQLPTGSLDANQHILPVTGTREALFAIAQCLINPGKDSIVAMPNPFYQIYEGACLLAGAQPFFINSDLTKKDIDLFNSISDSVWDQCQLLYICSPGNPTGQVLSLECLQRLIRLAHQHDFIIASDECYSEIYPDENNPPSGLLTASQTMGNKNFSRCLVFHSLSKRSNLPGLRSGFVAGDAEVMQVFHLYRTYQGCAMSLATQKASTLTWQDEGHVKKNRDQYREKFTAVIKILSAAIDVNAPNAGFYLWLKTPIDDEIFCQQLFEQQHVTVVPGSYLSRNTASGNPGKNYIRIALVAGIDECIEAAHRIRDYIIKNTRL